MKRILFAAATVLLVVAVAIALPDNKDEKTAKTAKKDGKSCCMMSKGAQASEMKSGAKSEHASATTKMVSDKVDECYSLEKASPGKCDTEKAGKDCCAEHASNIEKKVQNSTKGSD
jgi:hypothetical protein